MREVSEETRPRLPVFTESAVCPKCWGDGVGVRYCRGRTIQGDPVERFAKRFCPVGEHLHRTCTRCRFEWIEACRDSGDAGSAYWRGVRTEKDDAHSGHPCRERGVRDERPL